ncbi:MAG: hypothetical protein AAGD25_28045 [Cyanobacteria bacterium P01_F01_bin.150]
MSLISRRASVIELSSRVMEMATTGVYRESIFEALHPLATKKTIRLAIANAKQFGMYSIADLRDDVLGTYYQIDISQYQASKNALQSPLVPEDPAQAIQLAADVISTTRWMVRLTLFTSIFLVSMGIVCSWLEYGQLRSGLFVSAGIVWSIWHLQRRLLTRLLD